MLRCGLRVEEVAHLTMDAVEYRKRQVFVVSGKGAKDRVVYVSEDARSALETYVEKRSSKAGELFLVQKGPMKGKPISVRGIQKRIEYYAWKSGLDVSCHRLRHTFATQLLNADADLATIQDLLGHTHITTTQRYCRVANLKVQRDYYKAMELVLQRTQERSHTTGRQKEKAVPSWQVRRMCIPLHSQEEADARESEGSAHEGGQQWQMGRRVKRN
jgi:site-specific recombinase XerD